MQPTITKNRFQSIDVLRGLVMVIMALDHVRDFLYKADLSKAADAALDPTNMQTTFPALFFTRWITHFCAPIFVFLAGTSIYLMCQRKTKAEISSFLFKRGLWLIFVELIIISFSWTFNPFFNLFVMQVIWAIGISMLLLGVLIHLPVKAIFIIGLVIVAGHNIMDIPTVSAGLKGSFLSDLIYFSNFSVHPLWGDHFVIIVYAFLPWTGVMLLGYCFGMFFKKEVDPLYRRKMLIRIGTGLVLLFIVLRIINVYGDPLPWSSQPRGPVYSFLSFLNLNKYPPSLMYLCMTLGPGILFLAFIEKVQNKFTAIFNIYGRVPMFYYILHFYFIHLIVVVVFYAQGFGTKDIVPEGIPFFFKPNGLGFGLWGVYAVWAALVIGLYPLCKKYNQYKSTHSKWWLSYL
ncbi:MAG: DUF1624 domain-containing protein [Sphingobacteriales bacterium]|nr:DUF1624 domain-containing protein [Sphingobacteriales bacterium]